MVFLQNVLWYLPIIKRFKRLFANANDAKNLTWHADERKCDGCGSNAFQGYFDDAKESRANSKDSRIKFQQSRFKNSRIKFQQSRFKNNQDQDSRLKIQESREDSIKISTKNVFQNIE